MGRKDFVIELRGGTAAGRRTLEALELAAGLAQYGHGVSLLLHTAALARLGSARGDAELAECVERLVAAGVDRAYTEATGVPSFVGPLAIEITDGDAARVSADAVILF